MLVLRRAPSYALRQTFYQIRRWLRTSHDTDALSGVSEHKVTVTKINFSELPVGRVLPDGSHATSIGDWLGGLEATKSLQRREKPLAEDGIEQMNKPRKRSKKNAEVFSATASDTTAENKPKRRRRKSTDNNLDESNKCGTKAKKGGESEIEHKKMIDASPTASRMLGGVILDNLAKFPHCLLLTRVGQFYESYFDQAAEIARLLNIKLTSRPYNKGRISMCGFPLLHLDKNLKILVQQNKRFVAMCEEFPRYNAGATKPEFDRRVVRVITPGTLIDEPFLNQYENNYLLSICSLNAQSAHDGTDIDSPKAVGLAWIDVSTGEFFVKSSTYDGLRDELARIGPKEIVLDKRMESQASHPIRTALAEEGNFVSYIASNGYIPDHLPPCKVDTDNAIASVEGEDFLTPLISAQRSHETSAISLLTTFLNANLLEHMPTLSPPNREDTGGRMQIDSHTIKALEIRGGAAEGTTKGSLLSVVKRTVTSSGTRLLARWLCSPSTSIKEINARQSLVGFLYARPHLRDDILQALSDMEDTSRIVQKFILGRGDAGDLSAIHSTILTWASIKKRFELEKRMENKERGTIPENEWASLDILMSRMSDLGELGKRIRVALHHKVVVAEDETLISGVVNGDVYGTVDDGDHPAPQAKSKQSFVYDHFNWTIKPEFSEQLASLHAILDNLLCEKEKLERELQKVHDVPSLTLRASSAQGMYVHIQKSKRDQGKLAASAYFVKIAESGSTSSFFYQPWSQLGGQIVDTTNAMVMAERDAFEQLRSEVNALSSDLRRNARIMDELDVALGFANLAAEMNFTRPVLQDGNMYEVVNGRHPTVELGLLTTGRVFTPNSITLAPSSRLQIITGPNMAGKSTFLRQIALITILAQTGSFVPADNAVIGIVDKLFSRVGAKDDLFRDRSTFMVEMLETAEILKRATPNSLVIMDEVGRGTTVKDGLAIAFATVHHLVSINRCRALFATHFHELSDLLGYSSNGKGQGVFEDVGFFCTDVDETEDGRFAYSHRMRPGVNRDSHGLKVAQLAGMPRSAVIVAKEALSWLNKTDHHPEQAIKSAQLTTLGQNLTALEPNVDHLA